MMVDAVGSEIRREWSQTIPHLVLLMSCHYFCSKRCSSGAFIIAAAFSAEPSAESAQPSPKLHSESEEIEEFCESTHCRICGICSFCRKTKEALARPFITCES
jgi:hypothetical protein